MQFFFCFENSANFCGPLIKLSHKICVIAAHRCICASFWDFYFGSFLAWIKRKLGDDISFQAFNTGKSKWFVKIWSEENSRNCTHQMWTWYILSWFCICYSHTTWHYFLAVKTGVQWKKYLWFFNLVIVWKKPKYQYICTCIFLGFRQI